MAVLHSFKEQNGKFSWDGVEGKPIEMDGIKDALKHILIGKNEGAPNYIMRYFELAPGGHSRLETHPQEHTVIILRGKGKVQMEDTIHDVQPFDAVFIEGGALHQFSNPGDAPFGFVCVIPNLD